VLSSGTPVGQLQGFLTISGLFDLLQRALDRNPDSYGVTYDTLGVGMPLAAAIDYDAHAYDDEQGFHASAYSPL
jgi:hypothetical protein